MSDKRPDPSKPFIILTDHSLNSYAVIGELYALTLKSFGLDVTEMELPQSAGKLEQARDMASGGTILVNTIGPRFITAPEAFNIAAPWHEWSRYPAAWARSLNMFDQVWVPSGHIRDTLLESGVTAPLVFAPPALDMEPVPIKTTWGANRPFRFFSCGEPHFRKGFHLLMKGFQIAFPTPGEAELTIKTSPGCQWTPPREDINIVSEKLPRDKMLGMYSDYDAYVTASLGEGLDLPVVEASMALLPVAANLWGGHKNLLREGDFWRIRHAETPQIFCSDPSYFAPGQMCALSDPEWIAKALREIFEATAEQRERAAVNTREGILSVYGEKAVQKRFKELFGM